VIDTEVLPKLLVEHIPRQRWAGSGERAVESVALQWSERVASDPDLLWTVADVRFADGDVQAYQLFVGGRPVDDQPDFLHGKERQIIGVAGSTILYDALVDPDLTIEVLHLVDPGREVQVRRPMVLEHSNSSVVFDESVILKIFRKILPGPNPDNEITRVLAEQGYAHVLPPIAELRRGDTDMAVLRDYLAGSMEGWQLAHTSVRDLLASRLPPEECGGDFGPDAERLGSLLAGLHVGMAEAWDEHPGDGGRWAKQMSDDLDELVGVAGAELPFDPEAVRRRYRGLESSTDAGSEIRIHGDLHLAQVIRADAGWFVLDFEGEPARRREDRFTTSSPLRDVAGMLRSFHYAAATGLVEWDEDDALLVELTEQWEERARRSFLGGYLGEPGIDRLLPGTGEQRDGVLGAFELDKAVYEVGYELGHRPDWVGIPARAIQRVLQR
jgi:maltokinase